MNVRNKEIKCPQRREGAKVDFNCAFASLRANYLFANKVAATTPAVSARNLVSPNETGK